jgi:hypothetical protein
MPTNEELPKDESVKDLAAEEELEKHADEIKPEDAEEIAGGMRWPTGL